MGRSRRRPVLVVSHEASRTGAPRVAGDVVRTIGQRWPTVLVYRWGGPLARELGEAADRSQLEPFARVRALLRRQRRTRRLAVRLEGLAALLVLLRYRPAMVWLNTVLSACYVAPARRLGIPVVLHVHEMGESLTGPLDRYGLRAGLAGPLVHVVCCSQAVEQEVATVCAPAPPVRVILSVPRADRVRALATEEGAPVAGRTVVSCGIANHGKGVDVWLAAAAAVLAERDDDVTFVWVGRHDGSGVYPAAPPAAAPRVRFVGELANPYPAIAGAAVFTLLSRRESFAQVVLEAMVLGRPVVVTDVGGMADQVGDAGVLVPADDAGAAARAITALLDDEEQRQDLGQRAAARAEALFGFGRFEQAVLDLCQEVLDA